jgi:predicted ATPase
MSSSRRQKRSKTRSWYARNWLLLWRFAQSIPIAAIEESHELLAPVYGWFTEGFDTRDLQEAKALLHALAQ